MDKIKPQDSELHALTISIKIIAKKMHIIILTFGLVNPQIHYTMLCDRPGADLAGSMAVRGLIMTSKEDQSQRFMAVRGLIMTSKGHQSQGSMAAGG